MFLTKIFDLPLFLIPSVFIRIFVLNSLLYATQGTIEGSCLALEKGFAINLGGGYHHASKDDAVQNSAYPDI